jgi:hypothetical protein
MPFRAFVEPQDIIETPEGKFFVNGGDWHLSKEEIAMNLHTRRYIYDDDELPG